MTLKQRLRIIHYACQERGRFMHNYALSRAWRLFHVFKVIVCLLLNRKASQDYGAGSFVSDIATWGHATRQHWDYGRYQIWESLSVGYGWRDWYYKIIDDASM